jgi:hypothetical protein
MEKQNYDKNKVKTLEDFYYKSPIEFDFQIPVFNEAFKYMTSFNFKATDDFKASDEKEIAKFVFYLDKDGNSLKIINDKKEE